MENLAAMAVFAAVVEERGFSAAAKKLGISTPVVSKQVTALERRLGVRLLNRTTRRLSLTEAGASFYEHCNRIVAEAQEAELTVARLDAEPRGRLRVSAPLAFGTMQISPAVPGFLGRYPEIRLELSFSDRIVDLAEEGFDLAIRMTAAPAENLVARRLAPVRRVVCAAPRYLDRHGTPRTPQDLLRHNCIFYASEIMLDRWRFRDAEGEERVEVSGNYCVNSTEALRQAAVGGVGIIMVPSFIVGADLQSGALQALLAGYEPPGTDVYAVHLPNRYLPAKARAFIDYLVECFGREPYWDRPLRS